jgi:hypothetical protein
LYALWILIVKNAVNGAAVAERGGETVRIGIVEIGMNAMIVMVTMVAVVVVGAAAAAVTTARKGVASTIRMWTP